MKLEKIKYSILLFFLLMVIITNHIIVSASISEQRSNGEIINIAGKQRMYSQQITKLALYLSDVSRSSSRVLSNLQKGIENFKKGYAYLKQKNIVLNNSESFDILFKKNTSYFNKIITSYSEFIENPDDEASYTQFLETVKNNEEPFLTTMDTIVDEYSSFFKKDNLFIEKLEYYSIMFTVISLFFISVFMFLPMFKKNKELTNLNIELYKFKKDVNIKEIDKKRLEENLLRTNSMPRIGFWEVDLINQQVLMSKVSKEIHQTDDDYIPSLENAIKFYKEGYSRNTITEVVANAIENNIPYDEEIQLVTAKGNDIWVRAIGQAEFINNKCVRLYGILQDINTFKVAQIQLTKVNEEFNAILDSSAIFV